jgi:demethylmenaquinone methyltransferase / 2-methoxy-6-polyprenyl-1,4-benzoquinol methylase
MTPPIPPPAGLERASGIADGRPLSVAAPFDAVARHYDRVGRSLHFGSGPWYRRRALRRAGLRPGMKLLDVATGTGLLGREAVRILGAPRDVVGIDPSAAMLLEARKALTAPLARGQAEALPFRDDVFDMVSVGYAVAHVADLETTFRESLRVLKPGGRLVLLELARPESGVVRWLMRVHLQQVVPRLMRFGASREPARVLMQCLWDAIDRRVTPTTILDILRRTGFVDVELRVLHGFFSEYAATKPAGRRARPTLSG